MVDRIWASSAMSDVKLLKHVKNDLSEANIERAIKCRVQNDAGKHVPASEFPTSIWANSDSSNPKTYPDIFFANSFWVVSAAAADALRRCDLGDGHLIPVNLYKKDRQTPVGDGWFSLNFGNVKSAFISGSESPDIKSSGPSGTRWRVRRTLEDDMIAISKSALNGPDIWVDNAIGPVFFVSDRVAKALKEARATRGFGLKRCRLI